MLLLLRDIEANYPYFAKENWLFLRILPNKMEVSLRPFIALSVDIFLFAPEFNFKVIGHYP